ncbi:MAG: 50S ribosomal protein L23 [Candidatus Hydrothermarchaeota archaeon]
MPHTIVRHPVITEKSIRLIDKENKLVFIVDRKATKRQIKNAVEKLYGVEIEDVNVCITPRGTKKAYIKLKPEFSADEVATRIGIY